MTIALARRYRPRRFADLLVQEHVAEALRGAVAKRRVGHGYLLTGPRGVGKTTAARILAMALNCERRAADATGEPCGECPSCQRVWSGSANLDVVEIDAASNRGVDDARDLRERAMYAASEPGHSKVYIVDEAHMLTREAWNALLKILEEPPPGVVFVFATTEPQKIAAAAAPVMSRLQRFDFRRIGPAAIRERLRQVLAAESLSAEEDALHLIARYADGGMRDALSVLDQCVSFSEGTITAAQVRAVLGLLGEEAYEEVLAAVAERNPAAIFPIVARLMEAGADLGEVLIGLADLLRAVLMAQLGTEPEGLTEGLRQTVARYREALPPGDLLRMLRLLAESEAAIRRSATPRLVVETLLLRWTMMDRIVDLEAVLGAGSPPHPESPRLAGGVEKTGAVAPRASAPVPASAPPPAGIPFTLEGLTGHWSAVVEAVKQRTPFLGQAVGAARVEAVEPPRVTLRFAPEDTHLEEKAKKDRQTVEECLAALVGMPVTVLIAGAGPGGAPGGGKRPQRLSDEEIRASRLRTIRAADPSLDIAADELDLEIVDDGP